MPALFEKLYEELYEAVTEGEISLAQANTMILRINELDFMPTIGEIEEYREVTLRGTISFEFEASIRVPVEPIDEETGASVIVELFERQMSGDLESHEERLCVSDIQIIDAYEVP